MMSIKPPFRDHDSDPFLDDGHDHHPRTGLSVTALPKFLPNILTLMALTCGITSIQMAINGKYEEAVLLLLVAAVLDVLDGAAARLLKASSEFGAELDSLSDFLSFGVAPAILLYTWGLAEAGKLGWIATIALPAGAALRLARFNILSRESHTLPTWKRRFFSGVPSPAGAGLALLPIFIWFQSPATFDFLSFANPLIAVWLMVVGALMVSRLPTFSLKYLRIPARMTMPVLGLAALVLAAMVHTPWTTLSLIGLGYLISLPLGYRAYRRAERNAKQEAVSFGDLALGATEIDPYPANTPRTPPTF